MNRAEPPGAAAGPHGALPRAISTSRLATDPLAERPDPLTPPSGGSQPSLTRQRVLASLGRSGVIITFAGAVLAFALARPSTFWSVGNLQNILDVSAVPTILAIGLTFVLVAGDFDLSIGSMLGLGGAGSVALMSVHHSGWVLAILLGLALGLAAGLTNGFLIAYLRTSSFITTLAMTTVLLGGEYLFTGDTTLFANISPRYLSIGQSRPLFGLSVQVFVAAGFLVVAYVVLERTEAGRFLYAIGGNPEAARLAGVSVRRYRLIGFVLSAMTAAIAGILVTAQAGASTPNSGAPYLLPAYAAAFLGTAVSRDGQFNAVGTVVGALFLGVITDGLTMLGISTAYIDIIQGVILILAMLATGLGRSVLTRIGE